VLQHYRDVLKLLQTVLNHTRVKEEDYPALLRVVQELQVGKPVRYTRMLLQWLSFPCAPCWLLDPGRGKVITELRRPAGRPYCRCLVLWVAVLLCSCSSTVIGIAVALWM
jgi:hypothetical protein